MLALGLRVTCCVSAMGEHRFRALARQLDYLPLEVLHTIAVVSMVGHPPTQTTKERCMIQRVRDHTKIKLRYSDCTYV